MIFSFQSISVFFVDRVYLGLFVVIDLGKMFQLIHVRTNDTPDKSSRESFLRE